MDSVDFFSASDLKQQRQSSQNSSAHKLYSPQPVKLCSSYSSDANSSFGSLSPSFPLPFESAGYFSTSSPCKKLFSSPEHNPVYSNNSSTLHFHHSSSTAQPLFLDEINRLREDSMNQLENEINNFSKAIEITFDTELLLQQLDEDFANFPQEEELNRNDKNQSN